MHLVQRALPSLIYQNRSSPSDSPPQENINSSNSGTNLNGNLNNLPNVFQHYIGGINEAFQASPTNNNTVGF